MKAWEDWETRLAEENRVLCWSKKQNLPLGWMTGSVLQTPQGFRHSWLPPQLLHGRHSAGLHQTPKPHKAAFWLERHQTVDKASSSSCVLSYVWEKPGTNALDDSQGVRAAASEMFRCFMDSMVKIMLPAGEGQQGGSSITTVPLSYNDPKPGKLVWLHPKVSMQQHTAPCTRSMPQSGMRNLPRLL